MLEQISQLPARGAVVTVLRVDPESGDLAPLAVTTADGEGLFALELPGPGTYRAQADADGLLSPLSAALDLTAGDTLVDLTLVVPSRLLTMALTCTSEGGPGSAVLVGVVRDPATEVVLPDARVTASWTEGRVARWGEAVSDASGRYRICGVPPGEEPVRIRGELLGRQGPWEEVAVPGPAVVFHDVPVGMRTRPAAGAQDVVHDRVLMEAAARTLGDLHGQILDQLSGTPIPYAVVRIEGTAHQALADLEGRFVFEGIQPGTHVLEVRNLGYTVRSQPVQVPPGQDVFLGLRVAPQVVELEGLEVTTRSAVEEITRLTPFRRDIVYGEAMAEEEIRGARAFEILRRTSPGLRVSEIYREGRPTEVCVQTNRRIQRLFGSGECDQVQVVVDGVRIPDAGIYLRNLTAAEIESMEFLPPSQAQIQYGIGGNTANGVVVIHTRGRGPYASPLRIRR